MKKNYLRILIFCLSLFLIVFAAIIAIGSVNSKLSCKILIFMLPSEKEAGHSQPRCEVQSVFNEGNRKVYILSYTGNEKYYRGNSYSYLNVVKIYDPLTLKTYDFENFPMMFNGANGGLNLPSDCGSTQNHSVSLYKDNNGFYWVYQFLPHEESWQYGCEVSGFYVYRARGLYKNETSYKYYPVDCSEQEQAKKYLEVSGVDAFGDVSKKCYFHGIQIKQDCDLCNDLPVNLVEECFNECFNYLGIQNEDCSFCKKLPKEFDSSRCWARCL